MAFQSPKEALDRGIATVYQDLSLVPLMSVARNFFLGREPQRASRRSARSTSRASTGDHRRRSPTWASRSATPTSRSARFRAASGNAWRSRAALYFGAKVLILDEPTSALGVHQASVVLKLVAQARARGIGVVFISHNVHHAYAIGDRFTRAQPRPPDRHLRRRRRSRATS